MTDNEMEEYYKGVEWGTEKSNEKCCREMVNSIIAYSWFGEDAETLVSREENSYHNYLGDYEKELGRERVVEIVAEQIADVLEIRRGVYTDGEGCSYNSIVWKR